MSSFWWGDFDEVRSLTNHLLWQRNTSFELKKQVSIENDFLQEKCLSAICPEKETVVDESPLMNYRWWVINLRGSKSHFGWMGFIAKIVLKFSSFYLKHFWIYLKISQEVITSWSLFAALDNSCLMPGDFSTYWRRSLKRFVLMVFLL